MMRSDIANKTQQHVTAKFEIYNEKQLERSNHRYSYGIGCLYSFEKANQNQILKPSSQHNTGKIERKIYLFCCVPFQSKIFRPKRIFFLIFSNLFQDYKRYLLPCAKQLALKFEDNIFQFNSMRY